MDFGKLLIILAIANTSKKNWVPFSWMFTKFTKFTKGAEFSRMYGNLVKWNS